jgi:type IV pilus assembly protein PilV
MRVSDSVVAPNSSARSSEAGFTLVEVLIAIVILAFGLVAVTNLLVVAGTSNSVAHNSTGAVTEATDVMERLKAIPFGQLVTGGSLTVDQGTIVNCEEGVDALATDSNAGVNCVVPGNFNAQRSNNTSGVIKTHWTITRTIDNQALFIVVRSESLAPLSRGRSRAEFTAFRSCTNTIDIGCPDP